MIDHRIILSGRQADPFGSFMQGATGRAQIDSLKHENQMRQFIRENGEGLYSGSEDAMRGLAQFDPSGALQFKMQHEARARAQAAAARAAGNRAARAALKAKMKVAKTELAQAQVAFASGQWDQYASQHEELAGVDPRMAIASMQIEMGAFDDAVDTVTISPEEKAAVAFQEAFGGGAQPAQSVEQPAQGGLVRRRAKNRAMVPGREEVPAMPVSGGAGVGQPLPQQMQTAQPVQAPQPSRQGPTREQLIGLLAMPGLSAGQRKVVEMELERMQPQFDLPDGSYLSDPTDPSSIVRYAQPAGERRIITDAQGFKRYEDDGNRVFPDVQAPVPASVQALEYRANQAGLVPGSPEHAEFMLANGRGEGFSMRAGPDGTVLVSQGGNTDAFGTAANNQLDQRSINAASILGRLEDTQANYTPELLQVQRRAIDVWARGKDKFGLASPEDQAAIAQMATFKTVAFDNLSQTLKEMSGAAVTPQEFERLKMSLPNPGTGIFDGDSPAQFDAKLNQSIKMQKMAIARFNLWKAQGSVGNPWDMGGLNEMEAVIKVRAQEIAASFAQQGITDPGVLKEQVKAQLRRETGI